MEKLKSGKLYFEKGFEKLRDDPKIILLHVAVLLVSFVISHAKIGLDISPFGVALCSIAPKEFLFSCFIGQAFGYASSQSLSGALRYVISSAAVRLLLFRIAKKQKDFGKIWFLAPICVLFAVFVGGIAVNTFIQINMKVFFTILSESVIAATASYFFSQSFEVLENSDDFSASPPGQFICLIFSSGVFLLSLSSFDFYEVSLSRILVGLLVLLCAFTGGEIASCVAGVVGGISVGIYTGSSFDIISLALSGLLCGVFSPLGVIGCAAAYVLCRFAVFFFASPDIGLFSLFAECAASVTLFFALPKDFTLSLKEFVLPPQEKDSVYISKKDVSERMLKASECIGEICDSIDTVSEHLKRMSDSNLKAIYCRVQADVCSKCEHYGFCTDKNFNATYRYFEQISRLFSENDKVSTEQLPKKFASFCSETDELLDSFEKYYRRHRELMRREAETESSRNAFRQQLECEKDILFKFSKDFSAEKISDRKSSAAIKNLMRSYGIKVRSVLCIIDEKGVMSIKAICKNFESHVNKEKLKRDIEDMTLRKFERPSISFLERGITFEMEQKPWISVNTGLVKIPSRGASLCGDNCESFTEKGVLSVVISDGMGTGGRAAVDSAMSSEFFKKLVRNGFGENVALKIVNSSMLVKSSYESISTIDYTKIDLFTGKTQIFKAGAAATVIRKNGKCTTVEDASLPIGILGDIEFTSESFSLSPSDIIVMMSDGATSNGTKWIEDEVENYTRNSAEDLARSIALKALEKSSGEKQDDVTVFAAILS